MAAHPNDIALRSADAYAFQTPCIDIKAENTYIINRNPHHRSSTMQTMHEMP